MNQLGGDRSGDGGLLLSKSHSICLKNKKKNTTKNVKVRYAYYALITPGNRKYISFRRSRDNRK
jgi:hypothetical protein